VGTPSRGNGDIELKYVRHVCEQIGTALRNHHGAPVVAIRSTMLPGTMRDVVIPTLEACSGRRAGVEFGVCINPEFLREEQQFTTFSIRQRPSSVSSTGERGSARESVRAARGAAHPDGHRDRRDGQIRGQRVARAQGRFRQ